MDRRTFMMTGAWLPTSMAGVTGAWPSLVREAGHRDTLAIVDCSLACGPAFARYAAHLKLRTFDTGDDIGALWYTTLAPLLAPTFSLIGVIRASDYFVLHQLVVRAGLYVTGDATRGQCAALATRHAHGVFTFTPAALQHHST